MWALDDSQSGQPSRKCVNRTFWRVCPPQCSAYRGHDEPQIWVQIFLLPINQFSLTGAGVTTTTAQYSTNWLVFITETECVYCAVRSTFYVLPTLCIYVFCLDLRTNSEYFTVQHWLVGVYNRDGVYLLRGTFYVLPTQCIYVFCVDLKTNSYYFTVHRWLTGLYNRDAAVRTGSLGIFQGDLSLSIVSRF